MKTYLLFIFYSGLYMISCNSSTQPNKRENVEYDTLLNVQKSSPYKNESSKLLDINEYLSSHFRNAVRLDTLLDKITCQNRVKTIAELSEKWDDKQKCYIYSCSLYNFKLKVDNQSHSATNQLNTIFFDGKNSISFKDCNITCYKEKGFRCESYGFKDGNTLRNPKIIEVCGKRFLYSDVSYRCNGIGCGCNITFIYDLMTHKPTFLENYRIPYDGFFISDFDNNNKPDLLVISQSEGNIMKGYELEEFEVKLIAYNYNIGKPKVMIDKQYLRPYCYGLYSITEDYHHSEHTSQVYAVTKDNWLRP